MMVDVLDLGLVSCQVYIFTASVASSRRRFMISDYYRLDYKYIIYCKLINMLIMLINMLINIIVIVIIIKGRSSTPE